MLLTAGEGECYSMKKRTEGGGAVELAAFLEICTGITAVIGGGGKTTLLRTLGEELARERRVLLCTTTKFFPFLQMPCARTLEELDTLRKEHRLLCAGRDVPGTGKLAALDASMADLQARFDYVLVEADGSAQRPLKAHAAHEPVIPAEANQTICVVGVSGFGKPILEAAHRPELYARLAGIPEMAAATPQTEALVLKAEGLHDRVYVNQVETHADLKKAKELAVLLDCPVLAGSLHRGEYVPC